MSKTIGLTAGIALSGLHATGWASCGAAFCSVNTDWTVQDVWTTPGWRLDVRLEYIDQDEPRAGSDKVSVGALPRHHDEVSTQNLNVITTADYNFGNDWGLSLRVPVVSRDHEHIHHHHGAALRETWDFTRVGDVAVLGQYQLIGNPLRGRSGGLRFGLELPTGRFTVTNSEGAAAERSLQPGSGTTDLLLGGYYQMGLPSGQGNWFAQGMWKYALNERKHYRPGNHLALDFGVNYPLQPSLTGMLQVNLQYKGTDRGDAAEPDDSGSRTVALSPGLAYEVGSFGRVYGFVQVPVYQHVDGIQLTADWSVALGWTRAF